jgi:HSP20 family protein
MSMTYSDPFDVLLSLQQALEARRASDWLRDATTSMGSFPPINVFQQGDDFVAIIELPGVSKEDLDIQAKESPKGRGGKAARDFCDVMQCLTRRAHNG